MEIQQKIKVLFNNLSVSERLSLLEELKIKDNNTLINFEQNASVCPHCSSSSIIKHSKYKSTQRFKCKTCSRTFLPTTGTFIHNIKKKGKFIEYSKIISEEGLLTISIMSKRLCISIPTAFQWRHKLLLSIPNSNMKFNGEVQADDLWFLYSQKGRKGLKYARKRGGSKHKGDNRSQVKVIAASDKEQVEMKVSKIGRISKNDIIQAIGCKFKKNGKLITDGHKSFGAFAKTMKIEHIKFISKKHKAETGENVQYINNLASRLKSTINYQMRGVSTKYLQLYVSFFSYIEKNKFDISNNKFTSNSNVWDIFTNIEKMYEGFIEKKSERTYRCPTLKKYKSQNWNGGVIKSLSYI